MTGFGFVLFMLGILATICAIFTGFDLLYLGLVLSIPALTLAFLREIDSKGNKS